MDEFVIARVERLRSSASGNSGFKVTFASGRVARTEPDAAVAYKIENSDYLNVPVRVKFNAQGNIIDVERVEAL